ncbi:hypothetical protein MMC19_002661 [Ptychographa xylographoides]|nr:hypothetical protein [Ptychographa xylographoides]
MSFMGNMQKAYQVHKRKIIFVGALGGLGALQYTGLNPVSNILRTPGVENIEKRYSAGGGSKNHLPGAATPLGNHDAVDGNVQKHQGVGSEKFLNSISDQKPDEWKKRFLVDLAYVLTSSSTAFWIRQGMEQDSLWDR